MTNEKLMLIIKMRLAADEFKLAMAEFGSTSKAAIALNKEADRLASECVDEHTPPDKQPPESTH